jgi:hypothetical protein
MSDKIVRNYEGVVLRYSDPSVRRHDEQRPQVSDRARMRLIKAERELLTLQILTDHLELSDIALTRISDALEAIRLGLQVKRRQYGMQTDAQVAA